MNAPNSSEPAKGWLLNTMYSLCHKWSLAFNINVFNAMVKATSRSKIANHMLNSLTNRTTSLYDFLVSFEGW